MKNTKRSITFKVVAGYVLLTAFAAVSVWFAFDKIVSLTDANKVGNTNNERLILISEAVTNLYTAEGISRNIIQNDKPEKLPDFHAQIDTIGRIIDSLKQTYATQDAIHADLDSITSLLVQKENNLNELLALRAKNNSENYYDRVLNELEKTNYIFEDDDYEKRLKKYKPYVREVLVKYLEYAKEDNANTLTQQSADSLINTMKNVLSELEDEERRYQNSISSKENELLQNDRHISDQLRKLRSEIEQEEVQRSVQEVAESRKVIEETSEIIFVLGIACSLTILLFVILIVRDTNKSQQYRSELEKAKSYAELLLKQREQIMATVTHDLRSPLSTITGYSGLLQKTRLTDKQEHYLQQLQKSSAYVLHLVNDLLDFSKLESGKIRVEKLPFNPKNLIHDSISGAIPSEDPKNLKLSVSIEERLDNPFLSDPFRIQQILTNLIGNAYKFTDTGSIRINASLDTRSIKTRKLQISITDSGIGISKEHQQHIFEEFSQAKPSIEKQYGGSGLGLAITKKVVNLLGGDISLTSEPNKGSTFSVSIPVENAKHTDTSSRPQTQVEIVDTKGKKLLIVDDEPTQLALSKEIVQQAGFAFQLASNAQEGLKKLKKESFDLILTDIQMPKMNGFQFVRKLKAQKSTQHIPVIALSGRTEVSQDVYTSRGFETNIIKPFHANELLVPIARILGLPLQEKAFNKEQASAEKSAEKPITNQSYDLSDLHAFTDGDEASLKSILATFIDNSKQNMLALQTAKKQQDAAQIAFLAHRMLPMFRQLKAHLVLESLTKLEKQQELQLDDADIWKMVDEVTEQTQALINNLQKAFRL